MAHRQQEGLVWNLSFFLKDLWCSHNSMLLYLLLTLLQELFQYFLFILVIRPGQKHQSSYEVSKIQSVFLLPSELVKNPINSTLLSVTTAHGSSKFTPQHQLMLFTSFENFLEFFALIH